MNRITEITKRDILDLFQNGLEIDEFFQTRTVTYNYYGRLEEIDFLKRLYDLERMPSFDSRFANAEQDIWQHTVNNDDYPYCWVFEDKRFNLQDGSDEVYLKFLCEVFHPAVRYDKGYWKEFLVATNKLLQMTVMRFTLLRKYPIVMFMDGEYISKKIIRCLFHILNEMQRT